MYKKRTKLVASILVFMLTITHLSIVKEVLATSLENQTSTTNHANVEFDAYFMEENKKVHSSTKKIEEENYLYTSIKVKEAGYFKNVVVEMPNANFTISKELQNNQVAKIEENKIYFNQIKKENTLELAIPITFKQNTTLAKEQLAKENKIALTGTYVDGNGKENKIRKEITAYLAWNATKEAELNMQVSKFIPFNIAEQKGLVLQSILQSYLKNNAIAVKENKIEILVPSINGIKPEEVNVIANTTKATNGDETGKTFTKENYTYNKDESKLIITVENTENEQKEITWNTQAQDEFIINYIYSEEAQKSITQEGVKVAIKANSTVTTYEVNEPVVEKAFEGEITLKDQISTLVDFTTSTNLETLSKAQLYANENATNKLETEYKQIITANIGLANLTDEIVIEQQIDNFITEQNEKMPLTQTYNKAVEVDKKEVEKILGQEGTISLYNGTTLIATINKETKANENEKYVIDLSTLNTNQITIRTSKPVQEGKINFVITKAIKGQTGYNKYQIKASNLFEINVLGKALNNQTSFVEQVATKQIPLTEPVSKAELNISNSNLSTIVTNENVKLTAILKTDSLDCMLYKNPTLQITLPSYVENVVIKNIELLFDSEGSKLNLVSHEVIQNTNGTKTIVVKLEGTQTEYTLGAVSKGLNIVITTDISINNLTPNRQDNITMVYTNSNVITRARSVVQETGSVSTKINTVAPTGVVTTSTISNYKEGSENITAISGEEKVAIIPILSNERTAGFTMQVINNYNNTIDNISILGRTLFKGNTDITTGANLGSTIDMPLTAPISVNNVDASKVEIYYSENATATKDVNLSTNNWTKTPTNLANVKSYLIILNNYTMNTGDNLNFNYTAQIPANLQHNQIAYENYVVYFNNNLETGMVADKQVATKLALSTGRGPVIETNLTSNKSETEEVLSGSLIKYTLTVKNTGTEVAQNVVATIALPENLSYVELDETSSLGYKTITSSGDATINLGNIQPNQTITKEINLKVGNMLGEEESKTVQIKALISASNIVGNLETKTLTNTIVKTYYYVSAGVSKPLSALKEGQEYFYKFEVRALNPYDTVEETKLVITLPEEIEYEGVEVQNDEKEDITEMIAPNYDKSTRKLTLNLGTLEKLHTKAIRLNVKVGTLAANIYEKEVTLQAQISGKNARVQPITIKPVEIAKVGLKVTQSSNIPENAKIAAYEDITYTYIIENLSNINLTKVKLTDNLPSELKLTNITVKRQSGNVKTVFENEVEISLKGKEIVTIEVHAVAKELTAITTIRNNATIETEGINKIETAILTHIVEEFDSSQYDDPNYNPQDPENQTKRIMGTVWLDKNANGAREEDETKIEGVEVLLFNNKTGKLVTDSTGNIIREKTDANGVYTFSGIRTGKYTVIYLYDTANYSATAYKKENINETINSDAIDTKITLDGITRLAAITEEITVNSTNVYNIDLGLVENPKFDLKLDKEVAKITLQDATGTKVYEYEGQNRKLAKREIVEKQIDNTTIIVEYKIKVTNEGAISGFVKKIADYMPSEMKFSSELNKDWYTSENGLLFNASLANTIINPGETKEVTLILTKKLAQNNLGLYHNEAEIYESYNDLGIEDIDSKAGNKASNEDDISSADVLISVKTGETEMFIGLSITIITTIAIGAYVVKKKVLR